MVLEARKDADEIGYSLVGEETKESSNVVDYNINPEITKDASSVENANNQTTTGMANVIPGINAPKLIASTSIVGVEGGGTKLIEISDYKSVDERQPVVERALNGELIVVHCKFTSYSNAQSFYFTQSCYTGIALIFSAIFPGYHWFTINCWLSGTTVTSITTSDGSW